MKPRSAATAAMVYALGTAQVISWGSLFYAIGVLGPQMGRDLGVSSFEMFGSFTAGLIVSALCSPRVGRWVDEKGGRVVLSAGSVAAAAALAMLAVAWNAPTVLVAWIAAGAAMSATLYDPAFATLSQEKSLNYRSAVTALTLMGALASTAFWPLAHLLSEAFGWRATWMLFALLQLAVCLPLHLAFVPRRPGGAAPPDASAAPLAEATGTPAFAWLSGAFAVGSFVLAVCVVHAITLLQSGGLTQAQAVSLAMLMGPMQVAGRLAELRLARRFRAVMLGYLPFVLALAALVALLLVDGPGAMSVAFVVLLGWGNGIMTIARGTVPQEMFGSARLGELLGRLSRTSLIARALAPASLSALALVGLSRAGSLGALIVVGGVGVACYAMAVRARS